MARRKHEISSDSEEEGYKASKFVDVEASEEEDEEDEEEESFSDFINEIAEEAESEEESRERKPAEPLLADDFEEYSKKVEERYATEEEQLEVEEVPQQMLLPNKRSPKLWLVRCAPKKERHAVLSITRKCMLAERADTPMHIFSVLSNESVRGYLYIEAYQKQQVLQAIEGVQGVFKSNITQVPTKEMTEALFISEIDPVMFREGNILRVCKGKYAGEAVQIEGLSQTRNMVVVKIVPREGPGEAPELFSPDNYHAGEVYKISKDSYVYKKETYRNGYLIKDMPTGYLSSVPPPVPEEKRWFEHAEALEAAAVCKGEFVEVVSGGLKGATGTVISTTPEGAQIKIGERSITLPLGELRKRYAVGEEVQVTSGRKRGKSGFIIEINNDVLKIGINGFTEEIEVRADEVKSGGLAEESARKSSAPPQMLRARKDPLVNKTGSILSGEHKGKRGVVKDVHDGMLRVQLITSLKYAQVPKEDFAVQRTEALFKEARKEKEDAVYPEQMAPRTPPLYQSTPPTPPTPVHSYTPGHYTEYSEDG
ncbi:transcription elongation factor SPT5 [Nematocida sp. AWRm77]|nr:transcription elongation factor SPT5 [Nematocida sp. AWRm77]